MMRGYVFFLFFLYMYLSYIFYFKESTIITTEKQKEKQTPKIYRNEEDKSLPILFDYVLQETKFSFFFFQLVLNLNQYPFVSFAIKEREPPRSPLYLFSYFFPLSLLLVKNKSLSSLHLKWI